MRRDDEIDKELQFHVDQRIADYIASGLTPVEARRRAALEFGGVTQTKEAIRDQDSWRVLDSVWRDLRFRRPIVTADADLCADRGCCPRIGDRRQRDGLHDCEHGAASALAVRTGRRHRPGETPHAIWQQRQLPNARLPRADHAARRALGAGDSRRLQCRSLHADDNQRSGADYGVPRQRPVLQRARSVADAWPIVHNRR